MKHLLLCGLIVLGTGLHAQSRDATPVRAQDIGDFFDIDLEAEAKSAGDALARFFGATTPEEKDQSTTKFLDSATPGQIYEFVHGQGHFLEQALSEPDASAGLQIWVNSARAPLPFPNDEAQFLYAHGDQGEDLGPWRVSTGAKLRDKKDGLIKDHQTPAGEFPVIAMIDNATSSKYGGAPMPHAVFFKRGGQGGQHLMYAIHGTENLGDLGAPASHGCVRLHPDHAAQLFQLVKRYGQSHTRIHIYR